MNGSYGRLARASLVALAVFGVTAAVFVALRPQRDASVMQTAPSFRPSSILGTGTLPPPHRHSGIPADKLDGTAGSGTPLAKAIAETGLTISLPDTDVAGRRVRVVTYGGKGDVGLMVLFDSGVKLLVGHGRWDLQGLMQLTDAYGGPAASPVAQEIRTVAGRPTVIDRANPIYRWGLEEREIAPAARVYFNIVDVSYVLRAPDSFTPTIGAEDLVRIAESIRPSRGGE